MMHILCPYIRFHCGANPKYGLVETMPVWWPNEVFEWTALKNLSHRFEGEHFKLFKQGVVDPNQQFLDPDPKICPNLDLDPNESRRLHYQY